MTETNILDARHDARDIACCDETRVSLSQRVMSMLNEEYNEIDEIALVQ